jgi:hypothetical protein
VKKHFRDKLDKERIRSLARLVEGFLEQSIQQEVLIANPEKIDQLQKLLEEDLWRGEILREDPLWHFESDLYDPDNPDLYKHEEVSAADIESSANQILRYHALLKVGFWDPFRQGLLSYLEGKRELETRLKFSSETELSEYSGMADGQLYLGGFGKIGLRAENIDIHYSLEGGEISFFKSGIDALMALQNLVKGLPVDIFKQCKNETCGKVFVITSRHNREFCNNLCANLYIQRIKREQDPEGYRKYHKNYYRNKVLGS